MDILNMCRICLVENVKMYSLVNTRLQDIYEKMTAMPLQTEDRKPLLVCYLCRATLQTCYRLHIKCIRSDKLLNQMLESNQIKLTLLRDSKILTIKHPAVHLSYVPTTDDEVTHEKNIKEEFIEDTQKNIAVEEFSVEYTGVGKIKTEVIDRDEVNETDDSVHIPPATDTLSTSYAELHIEYDIKQEPRDAEEDIRNDEAVIENDSESQYSSNVLLKPVEFVSNRTEVECVDKKAEQNMTDEKFNTDNTEADNIVKIENVTEEGGDTSNHSSNCNFANKSDEVNIQDIKPDIRNINYMELSDSTLLKPIEISKEINLDCVETNAVLQNPKLNEFGNIRRAASNKSKTTATLEDNKKCKTKKSTEEKNNEEKQKVNKTSVKNCEHPFKCDICGKRFIRTQHLKQHMRVHTGEKPYKCDVCEKSFNQKQHLTQHIRLHTGEKPYKCDICEKLFNLKHNLIKHNRLHTGEKPFKCDMCDKSFTQKHHLIQHKNIHTGEKPYKCDICDKCFMRRQDLFLHNRRHTGVKPFKCDLCEKAFYQNHHLIMHTRRHTGEKPYKCDICDKTFNGNHNLKVHFVRMHTGDKPSTR